ncbi:MAG: hypothetical protein CMP23_09880 [Rickettsiales bacterium]|nr:hypothetical protein [Rickettsiales bacterium]
MALEPSRALRGALLSLPIAALALWWAFRGVQAGELFDAFAAVRLGPLLLSLLAMTALAAVRLLRWGVLVRAVAQVPPMRLLTIGSIGFMAIDLLPVRLGEFVRPVLLQRRGGVPLGAGMATIVAERIMDLIAVQLALVLALGWAELPPIQVPLFEREVDLGVEGRAVALAALALLGLPAFALVLGGERGLSVLRWLAGLLPGRLASFCMSLVSTFQDALRRIGRPAALAQAGLLTVAAWTLNVLVLWALLFALNIDSLGFPEATVVMLVVAVCIMLPAPAGGLGVFEAGGVAGLMLYGIAQAQAGAFAVSLHAVHVGVIVVIGVLMLAVEGTSWREMWRAGIEGADEVEPTSES